MTKLYFSTGAFGVGPTVKQSAVLPNGTDISVGGTYTRNELRTTPFGTPFSLTLTNPANQVHNEMLTANTTTRIWEIASVGSTDATVLQGATDWTLALQVSRSNTNLTAGVCLSIYVWTTGDTLRGYVYDSHTVLTSAFATTKTGQVVNFSGAGVAGTTSTDRLVVEVWYHLQSGMNTSYNATFDAGGNTDVTAGYTGSDPASYLEFTAAAGAATSSVPITTHLARDRFGNYRR